MISNRLPVYLYSQLNFNDVNFRINRASVIDAVRGTNCDPSVPEQTMHGPMQSDRCY